MAKIEKKSKRAKAIEEMSKTISTENLTKAVKEKTKNTAPAKSKAKAETKAKAPKDPNAIFRPGSKTDFVLSLLKKGTTFPDLRAKLEKKYGEKTANEKNARMYINNIKEKIDVSRKGDVYIASAK